MDTRLSVINGNDPLVSSLPVIRGHLQVGVFKVMKTMRTSETQRRALSSVSPAKAPRLAKWLQDSSHVSYRLNSLKGGYMGDYIGDYYGGY